MGIYDRGYVREDRRGPWDRSPYSMVATLIIVNVAMFVLNLLLGTRENPNWLTDFLSLSNGDLLKPWRWPAVLTYGFAHSPTDIQHLFFNMLALFFFGPAVESRLGRGEFLRFYLAAIILGGLVWAVRMQLAMPGAPGRVVGASGAVVAVLLLFIFENPRATILLGFIFPVPAWVLGALMIFENLYGAFTGRGAMQGQMTAFDVHLAGLAFAAAYQFWGLNLRGVGRATERWGPRSWLSRRTRLRVHRPDLEANYDEIDEEGDRILMKLHQQGEASLTARERNILEAYSRRMRQKHR